jgi:hypothetical protein
MGRPRYEGHRIITISIPDELREKISTDVDREGYTKVVVRALVHYYRECPAAADIRGWKIEHKPKSTNS